MHVPVPQKFVCGEVVLTNAQNIIFAHVKITPNAHQINSVTMESVNLVLDISVNMILTVEII